MAETIPMSKLTWSQYKMEARKLKAVKPNLTPTQIIKQLGYPHKFGKRIRITSNGYGGVKERNVPAHRARDIQRQIRLRIQTGKLSKEEREAIKQEKAAIRAQGLEVDHINESWLLGEQLEALRDSGGEESVKNALTLLKNAGYSVGDELENLQGLSPEINKIKYQQSRDLQEYLGSREALGQSPSARRPDLIDTGGYTPPELGGFQEETPGITNTAGTITYKPKPLEGIATDAAVPTQPTVTPKEDLSQPVLDSQITNVLDAVNKVQTYRYGLKLVNGVIKLVKFSLATGAAVVGIDNLPNP